MNKNNNIEVLQDAKKMNFIRTRHRQLQYVDEDGVIINKRSSTILKYCDYILALIVSHNMYAPYTMINFRDKKLLKKCGIDYHKGYSVMTDFLRRVDVIELTDDRYYFGDDENAVCQEYNLDIDNFVDLYEDGIIQEKILYPGMFHDVSADYISHYYKTKIREDICNMSNNLHMDYSCINKKDLNKLLYRKYEDKDKRVPMDVIINSDFYKDNPEIFKKIDTADYDNFIPTVLPNIYSYDEKEMLGSYASYCAENNPYYQRCMSEIDFLNKHLKYKIKMHMSKASYYDNDEENLILKPACRQYNKLCSVENRKLGRRDKMMFQKGFDLSFDIHSTIFTLMRYLNTGDFDIEWDIKKEIYPNYAELKKNEKWGKQFKAEVLMRCAFSRDLPSAWYGYKENVPGYHFFNYKEFERIYNATQELTGGTKKYQCNIFLYESLWELMVLHEMVDRGFDVANVYDDFYFKSAQTSIDEIKGIITDKITDI